MDKLYLPKEFFFGYFVVTEIASQAEKGIIK